MKRVETVFPRSKTESVLHSLAGMHLPEMYVEDALFVDDQRSYPLSTFSRLLERVFGIRSGSPWVRLFVVVDDSQCPIVEQTIRTAIASVDGQDDPIYVSDLANVIDITTGEMWQVTSRDNGECADEQCVSR